jgi:superfamily II DNA or RNA helicase
MKPESRPYQKRIITKSVAAFHDICEKSVNHTAAVNVESPVGSGKTLMGLTICKDLIDNHAALFGKKKEDIQIGWCAMRRTLLSQAADENLKFTSLENIHFVSMFDKTPPKVDILVFDESHHSAAESAVTLYTSCNPKVLLGLSATPYRTDNMKLCFNKSITDAGHRQLIEEGYLAAFDQYMLDSWTPESVTTCYLEDPKKWGKSICYFLTMEECYQACEIINQAGLRADVVTGQTDRESQLEAFEEGKLDILFNVFVLTEGLNCPSLKTVFCRPSVKGPTIQMCGRVFRKFGDKIAQIVQSKDTHWPFVRSATPREQWVVENGQWMSLKSNKAVNERAVIMREKICATDAPMPEYFKKRKKRRSQLMRNDD